MSVPVAHTIVVGALVRNAAGQVLLIRHRERGWELPQGRVETGEDLVSALHREVLEESGVEIDLQRLAAVYTKTSTPPALIFNFIACYRAGSLRPSAESPEVAWVDAEAALQRVTHPVNLDRLKNLLANTGEVLYQAYRTAPYRIERDLAICPLAGE